MHSAIFKIKITKTKGKYHWLFRMGKSCLFLESSIETKISHELPIKFSKLVQSTCICLMQLCNGCQELEQ